MVEYPGTLRFLVVGQTWPPAIINGVVNFIFGWFAVSNRTTVPVWSLNQGAFPDALGTCFFLPFLTCLIGEGIIRRQKMSGLLKPVHQESTPRWIRWFPVAVLPRAALFGLLTMGLLSLPVAAAFALCAGPAISAHTFLGVKVVFAILLGMLVTPLIVLVSWTMPQGSTD